MIIVERFPATPPAPGSTPDLLVLTWEQRSKTRQRVASRSGRDVALKLPTGTRLPPGTVVCVGEGFHVQVAAADEDVWLVHAGDAPTLARVAYEIGNRHFAIEIGAHTVAVLFDHTLQELWERLGVRAERVRRPFLAEERCPDGHHQ
jgi:urease accessory protein